MKPSTFLLLLCTAFVSLNAQQAAFNRTWYFTPGDNSACLAPGYVPDGKSQISVTSHWENNGYSNLDGFGWYYTTFAAAPSLLSKQLLLLAGKIDDADETYLNGVLIGKTGSFPPNASSAWNEQRAYALPKGLLKKENTLAIRVFDMGAPGGIHGGVFGLYTGQEYRTLANLTPGPKKSWDKLVTANGLIAAVINTADGSVESVWPHVFKAYSEQQVVRPFIRSITLSTAEKPLRAGYAAETHVAEVVYKTFTVRYFAPFAQALKVFAIHISGAGAAGVYPAVTPGNARLLADSSAFGAPGTSGKTYFYCFSDSLHNGIGSIAKLIATYKTSRLSPDSAEIAAGTQWLNSCTYPKKLAPDALRVYRQSATVLRMAQIGQAEVFPKGRGAMLASLPPGEWNICWIRDAAYSIMALNRLGKYTEAKAALGFFLNADAGYYRQYLHTDGADHGIGVPYRISVCRYFGTGKEESDVNDAGPNIELDGFGLFLTALWDYVDKAGDYELIKQYYTIVDSLIAVPLMANIAANNLIRRDSGPWERHLPGKQYAYTSITAAKGLADLALMCRVVNVGKPEPYEAASARLLGGIKEHLVTPVGYVKNNAAAVNPGEHEYLDAAAIEYFNFFPFSSSGLFQEQMKQHDNHLRVSRKRGYFRVNNGDWYDRQEWVFLTLRTVLANKKHGRPKEAAALYSWVTEQSKRNFNLIAELYESRKSTYEGAVPMAGFGAGAFILSSY